MNKITFFFITSFFWVAPYQNANGNDLFVITGKLDYRYTGKVLLKYSDKQGYFRTDSCLLKGNHFYFKGQVNKYYANAYLVIDIIGSNKSASFTREHRLGIENSKIDLFIYGDELGKIRIIGNITEKKIDLFYKILAKKEDKQPNKKNKPTADSVALNKANAKLKNAIIAYCKKFPSSNTSIYILFNEASLFSYSELNQLFNKISLPQQNSYYGSFLKRIMHRRSLEFTQVGLTVANFESENAQGALTNLYSLTRKGFVLLDFWATWCNPCRASSPALRNLYHKYSDAGFTIIGISCDEKEDEASWKRAIQTDSVFYWPHILTSPPNIEKYASRLDLLKEYDVSSFPTLILVGTDNKILLRASDELEVEKKLKEMYGK